ncbi:MAG: diaminopimelate decarboxylase [Oscillospiraceae bacterium]|nr:diaminopimelate decarboxylase [Oscillospiraceae bacterium]
MREQKIMPALDVNVAGNLTLGGCDLEKIANEYGTPAYVMDENTIVNNCRAFTGALQKHYGDNFTVAYASKALTCKEIYRIMVRENMGIDVVSGGELYTALEAGFPAGRVYFHGNNKSPEEIDFGLTVGIRRFVVDNLEELHLLNELASKRGITADIAVRIRPGVEAHTHEFIQTGQLDSKFGIMIEESDEFIRTAQGLPAVNIVGIHCHIGSQIFEPEPFAFAVEKLMEICRDWRDTHSITITELNVGGGFGIRYIESQDPRDIDEVAQATAEAVKRCALTYDLPLPHLVLEPGRAIVGNAGLTLYTVGSVKEVPGIRTYVAVDGGMTDNLRYALYQSEYRAVSIAYRDKGEEASVALAGRCCESGDLIAKEISLAPVKPRERIAVLATGAYNYSMANNYNRVPRLPIVMVKDGQSRVAVRRESYHDLCRNDA